MPSPRYALRRNFATSSAEETRAVGAEISTLLPPGAVVSLEGDLGAGKTTLIQGIAATRALVSPDEITSPTFALIHEYGDPVAVYHVDLYRLEGREQAERLGLQDLFDSSSLVLIEWGDRFPEFLPENRWIIRLTTTNEDERRIQLYEPVH